jgi:uncharacterized membrane protein (UPF0127 family)
VLARFNRCKLLVCLILTATIYLSALRSAAAAEPSFFLRDYQQMRLIISTTTRGCILFDIYVAQTPQQRSQGLMHIESMGQHEGMIFLYAEESSISMWMKNTLIPLDMLFIGRDSRIAHIHKNAVPQSEDIIESGSAVVGVLELSGGAADYFAIKNGDKIIFPAG